MAPTPTPRPLPPRSRSALILHVTPGARGAGAPALLDRRHLQRLLLAGGAAGGGKSCGGARTPLALTAVARGGQGLAEGTVAAAAAEVGGAAGGGLGGR